MLPREYCHRALFPALYSLRLDLFLCPCSYSRNAQQTPPWGCSAIRGNGKENGKRWVWGAGDKWISGGQLKEGEVRTERARIR